MYALIYFIYENFVLMKHFEWILTALTWSWINKYMYKNYLFSFFSFFFFILKKHFECVYFDYDEFLILF